MERNGSSSSERIAVVGSRKGVNLELVREFIRTLHREQPDSIVVSGGAEGVDTAAEQEWLRLGGDVISFRAYKVSPESYGVEEWHLGSHPSITRHTLPTFADQRSALIFRNTMIVEIADRLVTFAHGFSPGTKFTKYVAHEIPSYEMDL